MIKRDASTSDNETAQEVRHMSVLMEQVLSQNQLIMESVGDMQDKVKLIPAIAEDVAILKADMKIVKAAITDTNKELHSLDRRVTRLEAAN